MLSAPLDWSVECSRWPHAEASRFHQAGGLRWHVQLLGEGPPLLLVHGTGASAHSWRSLAPLLAKHFTVIAPDLPGHGFTERPIRQRLSLPAMAASLAALVDALALPPMVVAGHSAGAAILIRCCLDKALTPGAVVSINGALLPFRGPAGVLFPPLAKLLFLNPLTAHVFARGAYDRERVVRLIRGTGSELDEAGIELYARLFSNPAHVAATLGMMANWDLHRFKRDLPALQQPLMLISAGNDKAVAPDQADQVGEMLPGARRQCLPGLGHLAHEEDADRVAALILDFSRTESCMAGR